MPLNPSDAMIKKYVVIPVFGNLFAGIRWTYFNPIKTKAAVITLIGGYSIYSKEYYDPREYRKVEILGKTYYIKKN